MAAEKKETEMEYRLLGGTGLKVSVLSFGFWATFGVKEGLDRAVSILKMCRNAGINLFDNAEAYGNKNGDAEIIMGKAIKILQNEDKDKWRRSDLVITTKIFWGGDGQNEKGLSYKHIMEAMNGCLERLQLNYVDVVFAHRPDELTPTEEIVRAFTNIINSGKAFYWGTSEWSAQQITEAYWVAKENKLIPPVVEQPQYNLFHRDMVEREYRRLYSAPYRLGTTIWSPLASGILTGKYNKGIPEGTRMDTKGYEWLKKRWETDQENKIKQIEKLTEYAKDKFNTSVGTLAIAWCAKNPNVSCVLLGATKEEQLEENLQALNVARKLTAEHMEEIDKLLQNKPMDVNYFGRELKKTF